MTFEARDSAAKVVPARFKMSATGPHGGGAGAGGVGGHGSLRTSGSQTAGMQHFSARSSTTERRALTHSFLQFSRGLTLDKMAAAGTAQANRSGAHRHSSLKVPTQVGTRCVS